MKFEIDEKDALIVVDVQNCFCPGGAIPVSKGDEIVPVINKYIKKFKKIGAKIFATRDWHPRNHESFKTFGGKWPLHCVKGSKGAEFHPDLKLPIDTIILSKGEKPSVEGYSAFDHTDFQEKLENYGVERLFVCGLATDYCVKQTVLDALELGYESVLLIDAAKGVNANSNDVKKAIAEMIKKGARIARLEEFR